jgi:zinc/manganese transport system substrate-binding protein/manganese/iron transport system substrate-binding protein
MKAIAILHASLAGALVLSAGCGRIGHPPTEDGPLRVAATTSILGDVVAVVGGPDIALTVLLKPGQDPHAFNPTPANLAALSKARLLFVNGLGLETFLSRLQTGSEIVEVSRAIVPRHMTEPHHHDDHEHAAGVPDPHVWFDPLNVAAWTDVIRDTLAARDPSHAAAYADRAAAYRAKLLELDAWIRGQVEALPPARRLLVCDHAVLGYFADRYGFTLSGVLVPSFSTAAEPSARDLAALESTIRTLRIPALFVTRSASPTLAERVAADTGAKVATFYDGALSDPAGPAGSYLDFMRHNVSVFIEALKE